MQTTNNSIWFEKKMLGEHKLAIVFGMKFSELKEVFASLYKQTQTVWEKN